MRIVVVRQRPSIGDCLLLGPLLREVKARHAGCTLTVITDPEYMGGALLRVFDGIPCVDRVECISAREWTPDGFVHPPPTAKKADLVLDCNNAFLEYEHRHGGAVPYGIAEFWLRHFGYYSADVSLLPTFETSPLADLAADAWIREYRVQKPIVGVVMRAGHPARDWDFGLSGALCDSLHTRGYLPVSIDTVKSPESAYARAYVGHPLDHVASLLKRCAFVITPDTGLLHLAQAVGTPTVALWGIMPPELRVQDYETILVPPRSLGCCTPDDRACQCVWRFQQWSCLRRLNLTQILDGVDRAAKIWINRTPN